MEHGREASASPISIVTQPFHELLYDDTAIDELLFLERRMRVRYVEVLRARDRVVSQTEYYQQPAWKQRGLDGDHMLKSLMRCLASFDQTKYRRSVAQMEMHLIMTQACLRQIYGSSYLSKRPELLRRFGVSNFKSLVAIFATRRFGKTFALAQFIAAFMWTQERSVINVFSLAVRASKAIVDKIVMMLDVLVPTGTKLPIRTKNQEVLTIVNPHGIASTAYSFPCSEIRFGSSPSFVLCLLSVCFQTIETRLRFAKIGWLVGWLAG